MTLADPMLDPLGALLVEIRDDVDVDSLVNGRVRGFEPAPGDAKPAGSFQAFIILSALSVPPEKRTPVTFATYAVRCYGSTAQNAWAVYGALVKAIHMVGPRLKASGLGFYQSIAVSGGEQSKDPDTKQPVVEATISLVATTQAVTH